MTDALPEDLHISIIAGGVGTRLWPRSRKSTPKQLLNLIPGGSLIQQTYKRIAPLTSPNRVFVICLADQVDAVCDQLPEIPGENVVGEPQGRNTAMAIGLAAARIGSVDENAAMISIGSDHFIGDDDAYRRTLLAAADAARSGDHLVTIGIEPTEAHTGLGYIHRGEKFRAYRGIDVFHVEEFREKPDRESAERYVASGEYFWNSNYFAWRVESINKAFRRHAPGLYDSLARIRFAMGTESVGKVIAEEYRKVDPMPIDTAIIEKADNVLTVPGAFPWADIGGWSAAYTVAQPDGENFRTGRLDGKVIFHDSRGCLVDGRDRLVAVVGLEDVVIVETEDALLVCSRKKSELVGELVKNLAGEGLEDLL